MNRSAKGSRLDYYLIHKLVDQGFICVKAAASKSYGNYGDEHIDFIAIHPGRRLIYLVQDKNFKNKRSTKGEEEALAKVYVKNLHPLAALYRLKVKAVSKERKQEVNKW